MHLTRTVNLLYDSVLALLYPQSCQVCGRSVSARADGVVCATCWDRVTLFSDEDSICWKCGAPAAASVSCERELVRCRRCDSDSFTAARSCGLYEGALRASVLALKREPHVCTRLIEMLGEVQSRSPLNTCTMIIPVPLHRERERLRGFNQAAIIASSISARARIPVNDRSLIRSMHTDRHRAGMDAKGRRDTVAKAFIVEHPRLVQSERILLVDDVFTTGATASACASALLDSGAVEVFVLTLARALTMRA